MFLPKIKVIFALLFVLFAFVIFKQSTHAQAQPFPQELYSSYGFPNPSSPKQMSEDTLFRWNNYLRPHAQKAAQIVGVDVGLIGMWPWLESQITTLDNCGDSDHDPNTLCNWNDTLWQVGWGIFPEWESVYLQEAVDAMRPGETLQQIGNRVISESQELKAGGKRCPKDEWYESVICKPYNPSYTFPNVTSVNDLISKGKNGDLEAQKQVALLMKDDAIGAYILAKKFKSYVDNNSNKKVADLMAGWPPYTPYQPQNVVNYIAGVYAAGTSTTSPSSSSRYRTTSNTVRTRVGNPASSGSATGTLANILEWAQKINDALEPGVWDYRNKMMADICNTTGYCAHKRLGATEAYENGEQLSLQGIYWCTFIVIDSYNLAGRAGLTPEGHLAVVNMIDYWKNTSGYQYLDYQHQNHADILKQVKPGYAYFLVQSPELLHTAHEHTGLVKSITFDSRGNGTLVTVESNSSFPGHSYPIVEWEVQNTHYPLRGFGASD